MYTNQYVHHCELFAAIRSGKLRRVTNLNDCGDRRILNLASFERVTQIKFTGQEVINGVTKGVVPVTPLITYKCERSDIALLLICGVNLPLGAREQLFVEIAGDA